eukprot:4307253-Prymnesium_polylepis.2
MASHLRLVQQELHRRLAQQLQPQHVLEHECDDAHAHLEQVHRLVRRIADEAARDLRTRRARSRYEGRRTTPTPARGR